MPNITPGDTAPGPGCRKHFLIARGIVKLSEKAVSRTSKPRVESMTGNRLKFLCLYLVLSGIVLSLPLHAAPDDTRRDLKGFDEQMVRREQARRELVKGKAFLKDRSYEMARQSLANALRLNQDLQEARFCLGLTEYGDRKFKLAVAHFEKLYEQNPDYENLRLELARGYLALGQCGTARKWLKRYLEHGDKNGETKKLESEIEECEKRREKQS